MTPARSLLAALLLFAVSVPDALAGSARGLVGSFKETPSGAVAIKINATTSNRPTCSNGDFAMPAASLNGMVEPPGRYASVPVMKDALASAKAGRNTVTISGTGMCTILTGHEDVAFLTVE